MRVFCLNTSYKLIMWRYFSYEMKRIWQRMEVWFVLIASLVIAILAFFYACSSNAEFIDCGTTLETIYSAERYTLLRSGGEIRTLTTQCLIPIFATILASTSYGKEKNSRLLPVLISRGERSAYYSAKGITVAVTAFVGSILPFLFSGIFAFIAVPIKEVAPLVSFNLYESNTALYSYETGHMLFPALYWNSPVLDYLAHVLLIGLYGVGLGLLAYAISFFFHKRQVILILLPMIISYVASMVLSALGMGSYIITIYFSTRPNTSFSLNAFGVFAMLLSFILIGVLLILTGIKRNEDIL